jgi:methylated-DNA-[protein]-cysteine S-methyltransferase
MLGNNKDSFTSKVLCLVKTIPSGKVTTYKLIAERLGTKAYRAVGNALKNNKNPIVIPCHRVVKSDGSVGGYKGRLNNPEKKRLLEIEGITFNKNKVNDLKINLFRFYDKFYK